jgi:hypothetical protein
MQQWIPAAIVALVLAGSATLGLAQNTNPTNTFDAAASTTSLVSWWGGAGVNATMSWDGTRDAANDPNSGSGQWVYAATGAAGEQFMTFFTIANRWQWDDGYVLDATTYTNLSFDIFVDPSSSQRHNNNDYGNLEVGLVTKGWATTTVGSGGIPLSAKGAWKHISYPLNPTLNNINQVVGFYVKMWINGDLTNTLTFNIDNYMVTKPTAPVIIPPPTLALKTPGSHGVTVAMGSAGGQWDRQAISTPAPDSSYIWTAQGGYPVSYSCTITNWPAIGTHQGYEAHMYIVNGDTAGSGNNTSGSPDWNCPDLFIFRVENNRNTVLVTNGTTITTNYTYDALAQIQWKTNYPAANATNIPVVVHGPGVLGTWTVTFTDANHGSLIGPGITATNFTLPADAVANNFSPSTSFVQFGNFKNDGANDGHNDNTSGTFSQVSITGAAAPINDNFSGATLTNTYAWRKTSATEVQYVAPGTAWLLSWTLPDTGFTLQSKAKLAPGEWTDPGLTATYFRVGNFREVYVPSSALPSPNSGYFTLIKRVPVQLQVLLPGETNAPGTVTGKIGTPLPQMTLAPFNVTVNACDATWHIAATTDTVHLISSDPAFFPPPTDSVLVNGTAVISTAAFGSTGTWTITASDVTNTNVTSGVSSPVSVPQ